ncbi:hypothetical protein GCM10022243_00240 [Saccharothrix violaceirubra]
MVKRRRQQPMAKAQHGLEQPDDARRTFQVTDVRLGRSDEQLLGAVGVRGGESGGFDRVADRRAGPVQLDVLDLVRPHARAGQRRAHHLGLCLGTGHGQPARWSVVVHRAAEDHRVHPVAVRERPGQRLEHDDTAALAPGEPVGVRVERATAPVR